MHAVDYVIGFGWLAFWLYWLSAAVGVKAADRSSWRRFSGVRIALALVVAALTRTPAFRGHPKPDAWLVAIGLALFVLGLTLAIWARGHLGKNWGPPMTEKQAPDLVTTGPYRWIRNPIYSGLILAGIGTALALNLYWLVVVAIAGGYFVFSAVMEQRYMAATFPDTYPEYQRSTKMLIPYVF